MRGLFSLYSWRYPMALIQMLVRSDFRVRSYLKAYWHTNDFSVIASKLRLTKAAKLLLVAVWAGVVLQLAIGAVFIWQYVFNDLSGGLAFGLAIMFGYPLVWAHLLALVAALGRPFRPKALGRTIVCSILESQVKRLRHRHRFKVVAVVGSAGKTSTKIAVARVLQATRRVRWQEGNYNDRVTVPLVFFDHVQPNIMNVFAWLTIFWRNEQIIRRPYKFDVVVVELGTDGPGFIKEFAYIQPDLAVVTAVAPEHMEYFGTLEAVAREELAVLQYARQALLNKDDIPAEFYPPGSRPTYGLEKGVTYRAERHGAKGLRGQTVTFHLGDKQSVRLDIPLLGEQGAKIALAAAGTAHLLDLPLPAIEQGLKSISAFMGRMQVLDGINDSTLIDDTYNASPIAVKAALDVVYGGEAPQRIAILGGMNELGQYSAEAHKEVGECCNPDKLDLVVTIGREPQEFLAPAARERGCDVHSFLSPYKAGQFVRERLKKGAVVLAKGSQNGVFAEEALKSLLANKADEAKLVRQSPYWMRVKQKQFGK